MSVRHAEATWRGSLREGSGDMKLGSGACESPFSFGTRFEENPGSNPEELVGAALAGCYSMALSANLGRAGFTPDYIRSAAHVHFEKDGEGFKIVRIDLDTEAKVPGVDESTFQQTVQATKSTCPISRSLNTEIVVNARLVS